MRYLTTEGNINVHNYSFDGCIFTLSNKRIKKIYKNYFFEAPDSWVLFQSFLLKKTQHRKQEKKSKTMKSVWLNQNTVKLSKYDNVQNSFKINEVFGAKITKIKKIIKKIRN